MNIVFPLKYYLSIRLHLHAYRLSRSAVPPSQKVLQLRLPVRHSITVHLEHMHEDSSYILREESNRFI